MRNSSLINKLTYKPFKLSDFKKDDLIILKKNKSIYVCIDINKLKFKNINTNHYINNLNIDDVAVVVRGDNKISERIYDKRDIVSCLERDD